MRVFLKVPSSQGVSGRYMSLIVFQVDSTPMERRVSFYQNLLVFYEQQRSCMVEDAIVGISSFGIFPVCALGVLLACLCVFVIVQNKFSGGKPGYVYESYLFIDLSISFYSACPDTFKITAKFGKSGLFRKTKINDS